MHRAIPLSKYILNFELVSILGFPFLLLATRWVNELTTLAKLWGGALILGVLLQVFATGYERTYTYPMRWSLQVPDEIRMEVADERAGRWANQIAVVFSRPALTEDSATKHVCYQVMFGDALAKRLQDKRQDIVDVEYDATFRFDTPVFWRSPRLQGDNLNASVAEMGFMSQGYGTSGYTCFPGPGIFR